MINELTKEQEVQLVEFREQWRAIGLSTEPANFEVAKNTITKMYKLLGHKKPEFWLCQSPLQAELYINLFMQGHIEKLGDNLRANLGDNLRANLGANLRDNLRANLGDNLWDNLRANLGDNLRANLGDNLWDNLRANLRDNLRVTFKYNGTYCWGQQDAHWIAFYLFPLEYLGIKYNKKDKDILDLWKELAESCGWIYFYENICFICDRPKYIGQKEHRLHNEKGMVLEFRDGYGFYSLNGVTVPEWLVMTKTEDLKPEDLQKEELKNVDIRREFIRKIGVDRLINYGEVIHEDMGYKLVDMKKALNLTTYSPYLMMKNPSIGIFHLEGVEETCKTVKEALAWRNQSEELPVILT